MLRAELDDLKAAYPRTARWLHALDQAAGGRPARDHRYARCQRRGLRGRASSGKRPCMWPARWPATSRARWSSRAAARRS